MNLDALLEPVFRLKQSGGPDEAAAAIDALIEAHADDLRLATRLRIERTREYAGGPESARQALQTALDHGWEDLASRALSAIVVRQSLVTTKPGELARMADRALALAGDDPELRGHALEAQARVANNQGRKKEAKRLWTEALRQHEACGHRIGVARHLYRIGQIFQWEGALAEASTFYDRAEEEFVEAGDVIGASNVLRAMAENAVAFGHLDEAEQLVRRCIHLERLLKRGRGLCTALNALGEVLRTRGDLSAAEDAYKQALEVQDNPFVRMNLALCLQAKDRHAEARESLQDIIVAADTGDQVAARCLILPSLAALGDVAGWRDQLGRTQALLDVSRAREPDLARCLERAGDHWAARGGSDDLQRAVRAYRLATEMWRGLGKDDDAERVWAAIDRAIDAGCRPMAGPWDLQEPLGRGSMGVVWLGRHQETGDEAALKLLHHRDPTPRQIALVEAEAQAVARLDHENIVRLLGYGTLDEASARVAGMMPGTPWFATELATGGTLLRRCGHVSWDEARAYLLQLLSALGHAHAHGLLHLDLKPENVLLHEGRPRLADFGVAAAVQLLGQGGRVGTPGYMAPEQFDGRTRLSPQTDMYALGCLAVHLVTGSTLYPGLEPAQQEEAHLKAPLPAIAWPADVPPAFDEWVARLLAKEPATRFERAADAALVLRRMTSRQRATNRRRVVPSSQAPTWEELDGPGGEALPVAFSAARATDHPPVRLRPSAPSAPPASRAPEILAWRPLPIVGREQEREQIWSTLRDVAWGNPRAVILEGPDTLGRSALARELCAHAHEVGAADVLRADEGTPPVESILRGLMRAPGSLEAADNAIRCLWPGLGLSHARALALAATGEPSVDAPTALVRALQRQDARRVIVHLQGEGMVPLAEALLRSDAAVLVLLEVEGLGTLSEELLLRDDSTLLSLEPVDDATMREICNRMLPVGASLATKVAARASGHPGLAAELLHRLVSDHALSLASGRWVLTAGLQVPTLESDDELPALVVEEGPSCLAALAGLAGLRRPVEDRVWIELCALPADDALALARRLAIAGLLRWSPSGLALVRPQHQAELWRRARQQGVLDTALQRAAPHAATDALRGELLLEAGHPREALPHLLRGARADLRATPGVATTAQRLLGDAVRLGGVSARHPLAVKATLVQVERLALANELREAERCLADLPTVPDAARGDHARTRGLVAMMRGELSVAVEYLETARALDMGDGDTALYLGHALAGLSRAQGRHDEALAHLDAARREAEEQGRPRAAAVAWMGASDVHRHRGDLEAAAEALRQAEHLLDPSDPRWVLLRLNQALLALTRGQEPAAAAWLDELAALEDGRVGDTASRHLSVLRLAIAADVQDDAFDSALMAALDAIEEAADPDHAHCLELAAARAADAGHAERARVCLERALDVWSQLERADEQTRVEEALARLA